RWPDFPPELPLIPKILIPKYYELGKYRYFEGFLGTLKLAAAGFDAFSHILEVQVAELGNCLFLCDLTT
ncbi:MAG: hypothetical protein ACXWX7_12725, partial [Candidatus Binatia bacterium]